ncbi:MAG: TldD/PmbA family protein [Clostridiales bacterium]|jgi:PmbA protein|nr:TldD/PmbA family protein [Clostridiales bacterium]
MELADFKDLVFEKAKRAGFTDYEIYYEKGNAFLAKIYNGEVKEFKNAKSAGLSFRGNYNGKTGYSYTAKIDADAAEFLIESAKSGAAVIDEEKETIYAGSEKYIQLEDEKVSEMPAAEKIEKAKVMEKAAYGEDARIKQVPHAAVGNSEGEIHIFNSAGLNLSRKSNIAYAYVYAQAEENSQTKMGWDIFAGKDFTGFDEVGLAKKAVKNAVVMLGARDVKTGKYPVIFENKIAADLIAVYSGIFFAENVQKGFSLLGGKIGEKIASDIFTLNDYALCDKSLSQIPFDSEGVAAYNKAVIKNGILETYLYNLKSAARDNTVSTGNGFKGSYKSPVTTACLNFFVSPGETTEDELLEKMVDGIYVNGLAGLHSGTNAVSGDFSLKADGFIVQGGKISYPIEQFTVAGNFYELIKNIKGIADNLFFDLPGGGGTFGSPSLYVGEVKVSGGE